MSSFTVEFLRPDGNPLRYIDAGFEFIEADGIPLANAERPIRLESDDSTHVVIDLFGNHQSAAMPLPDGQSTTMRIVGEKLPMMTQRRTEKCVVVIDGVEHDLNVSVTTQLTRREHRTPGSASTTATQELRPTSQLHSPSPPASIQPSKCPNCGSDLKVVRFRLGSGFKEFLGCSNFPSCRYGRSS